MTRTPPTIDMLPDGRFGATPRPPQVPFTTKVMVGAAIVAMLGTCLAVAALALWFVSLILPVVLVAAAVAWGMMRFRRWQSGRGQPDLARREPDRFR